MNKAYKRIGTGFWMILIGLILPEFIQAHHFGILADLKHSIAFEDSGRLLLASAKLVLLNTLRAVPIYTGTFIMAEGFYTLLKSRLLGFIFPLIMVPLGYKFITVLYGISYDFGSPAYLTLLAVIILHQATVKIHSIFIKVVIASLFLFGMQWLDIVPLLSKYRFGRGELSVAIKRTASFLNGDYLMNFVGLTFSVIIIVNALILARVVISHYNQMFLMEESKRKEKRLRKLEMEAVKSRYLKEIKSLVHDLKTPLVTIQGLSDVIGLKVTDQKIKKYTQRISGSVETMSKMISEILYNRALRNLSVQELFNFIEAQLSPVDLGSQISFSISGDLRICGNKIRISRAIINLIDNSLQVIERDSGWVKVQAYKEEGYIYVVVDDNGPGISPENLEQVWDIGFSTGENHTGLGLNFVKTVIEEHGGKIGISSAEGKGTKVEIILPEVADTYG